jgi:hypothetical protein
MIQRLSSGGRRPEPPRAGVWSRSAHVPSVPFVPLKSARPGTGAQPSPTGSQKPPDAPCYNQVKTRLANGSARGRKLEISRFHAGFPRVPQPKKSWPIPVQACPASGSNWRSDRLSCQLDIFSPTGVVQIVSGAGSALNSATIQWVPSFFLKAGIKPA